MNRRVLSLILCTAGFAAVAACTLLQRSASSRAKALLWACNDGRYSDAEALMEWSLAAGLKADAETSGGIQAACASATHSRTLAGLALLSERTNNDLVSVTLERRFTDGRKEPYTLLVVREDGVWRVHGMGLPER